MNEKLDIYRNQGCFGKIIAVVYTKHWSIRHNNCVSPLSSTFPNEYDNIRILNLK